MLFLYTRRRINQPLLLLFLSPLFCNTTDRPLPYGGLFMTRGIYDLYSLLRFDMTLLDSFFFFTCVVLYLKY